MWLSVCTEVRVFKIVINILLCDYWNNMLLCNCSTFVNGSQGTAFSYAIFSVFMAVASVLL